MVLGRREFLAGAGSLALTSRSLFAAGAPQTAAARAPGVFPPSVRADFPSVLRETYLNSAALHPVGSFTAKAMQQLIDYRLQGPGEGRSDFGAKQQQALKEKYGALINATADEIAYSGSTSDGENIVVMGLDLAKKKGNVVIDELHFTTSLYMYKELEKQGVELRIVKHRNWAIDPNDMDKAIDRNTRLVSMALVSNVNGFMMNAVNDPRQPYWHPSWIEPDPNYRAIRREHTKRALHLAAEIGAKNLQTEPGGPLVPPIRRRHFRTRPRTAMRGRAVRGVVVRDGRKWQGRGKKTQSRVDGCHPAAAPGRGSPRRRSRR